ncbi:WD40 repeat domain-containing serine/threonine protein kinase [Thermogemmatispora carboxidivorans]|uniref:WD40 repeat domain-containing serine/threonine protein kinase n=1 Tax=Thermogemmatispora carboxidivorans TaxID=1382306 RepID=UPI000699B867|nr:serine/threonine-protein kinase [Thermogemmatispora carboxidivorans]
MAGWPGQRWGNYELVQLVGQGAFAEVYLGRHIHLGTVAAVKLIRGRLERWEEVEQFMREAQLIAELRHPHIVRLLEFGFEGRGPFLVLDYAPGGTLRQRHPRGTRVEPGRVVAYVKQVAEALQYAHERGVVHRDVKPENMLVGEQGEILLSDFRVALLVNSAGGTVPYIAPEQVEGRGGPRSDQYALGVCVYEWLSGELPFQGSWTEVLAQKVRREPPSLRERGIKVGKELEGVVRKALAREPEQRFGTVKEWAEALEEAVRREEEAESKVVIRRREPAGGPALADTRGKKIARRGLLLVGMSLLVVGGLSWLAWRSWLAPGRTLLTYRGHSAGVQSVAWSPDGRRLASGSDDGTVQVWEADTGKQLLTYRGHSAGVQSVAWSPDGRRLASGSDDGTVQVWEADTGKQLLTYRGHSAPVESVTWSPEGKRLASGSDDKTVQVWEADTGKQLLTYRGHSAGVQSVAWAPEGKRLASGSDDETVQVWEADTGKQLLTYRGHSAPVESVAWAPEGKRLASGSWYGMVQVWEADTGQRLLTYQGRRIAVESVAWAPEGKRLASESWYGMVQVWEADTGQRLLTYQEHRAPVESVAWSPEGKRLASGSLDTTVQVWSTS